jgi:hypothetical protein
MNTMTDKNIRKRRAITMAAIAPEDRRCLLPAMVDEPLLVPVPIEPLVEPVLVAAGGQPELARPL